MLDVPYHPIDSFSMFNTLSQREDQRDDNMLESKSDGVKIFSNCNILATNDDNFRSESNDSNIIRSKTNKDNIIRSENQGIHPQNIIRFEINNDIIIVSGK